MKKILPYIKNKYLLTVIGLGVWIIFFDKNDLSTQLELRDKVRQLEKERDYFANEIEIINNQVKELTTNPEALERFAREEYLMKRDNEDIFVIVEQVKAPTSNTK
ncbi:MAG: septum formation initiator family protein [Bacteroidia bacterium]